MLRQRKMVAAVWRSIEYRCRAKYAGWLLSMATLVAVATAAEPYIPVNDNDVLETLARSLVSTELTTLRRQLANDANNTDLASKVGERFLQMGNLEGDPR